MIDFKKLREYKAKPKPKSPRDIFNALPKPPGINDLYASQAEVLDAWYSRREEKDVVVKLHTGGGKTLVALLMAQSVMNEIGEAVLYLTPTKQLVKQVLTKSKEYGIAALPYTKGQPLPTEFHNGNSVLVGTYQALFNGHSKFGVQGLSSRDVVEVGAIILDDAHAAFSSVRQAFTLTISVKDHKTVYTELADRFRPAFREVGRQGLFKDIINGKDFGVIEVPSWAWHQKLDEIQQHLSKEVNNIDNFVWPFLRDKLNVCHCLFSKSDVSITPLFPLVDMLPTFDKAKQRIYMSATIADDSEIVRTFGSSQEAISNPITSISLAGVGERMILVPNLMKLGSPIRPMMKAIAQKLVAAERGVAILTPSGAIAEKWIDVAEYPENTETVLEKVTAMQDGETYGPLVLANRYDGIDLAGNSCRFLIIDDLPQGTTNYDVFRANAAADAAVNSLLAQRIEQGIGRGTRGGADFCVIILIGSKLTSWIGRKKNLDFLTASTRVQLEMGQEVSEAVTTPKDLSEAILKCLNRDQDWVDYHASVLVDAATAPPIDHLALKIAAVERKAFNLQCLGQYGNALAVIEKLMGELTADDPSRAWLAASAARIAYQMNKDDKGQKLQTTAYLNNHNHTPPRKRPAYVVRPVPGKQATAIVECLARYNMRMAILMDFDDVMSNLVPEASASRYEEALADLGLFLGFDTERPEKAYNTGPDVLWRTDVFDFVIEVKSDKDQENPLYKREHAQLLEAANWFKQHYPDRRAERISALPEAVADEKATPIGSFAFRLDDVTKVASALRGVLGELAGATGEPEALPEHCEAALIKARLKPEMILDTFMKPFGKAKPK